MAITTFSSRKFNQDIGSAKKASLNGPVFITDRGKPAHVLLSIEEYQRLAGKHRSIVEALSMPALADIDFEPQKAPINLRPADLT